MIAQVGIVPPFVLLKFMNIYTTQLEARIYELLEGDLNSMGYEILRLRYGGSKASKRLQIMIERSDGQNVNIKDCENTTNHSSVVLDVSELLGDDYSLEVSSAGLNKPLTRAKDFIGNVGKKLKLSTKMPVEGQRNFQGKIFSADENNVVLDLIDNKGQITLKYDAISEASLVYFDENENKNKRGKHGKL